MRASTEVGNELKKQVGNTNAHENEDASNTMAILDATWEKNRNALLLNVMKARDSYCDADRDYDQLNK